MFYLLEYRDTMIIMRGLLILVIVIMLGVTVTEKQLNNLTHRHESVQVFNIASDQRGAYSIHLLGANYNIRAIYAVGELIDTDKAIIINTTHQRFIVPTYIEFDCRQELVMLDLWAQELVDKGFKGKQSFNSYLDELKQKVSLYIKQSR